jgi:predicted extracellular nuclease
MRILTSAILVTAAPLASAGNLVVGSWNIEHLGDRKPSQNPAALAELIAMTGVDILALQEIHDTDDAESITNATLDKAFDRLREFRGADWKYVLHRERDGVTRNQHVGIAWNAGRVELVGEPYRIPVEYANDETWKRHPHAVKLRAVDGSFDAVFVSIHLKSNNVIEGLPAPDAIRKLEVDALIAQLPAVREHFAGETDFVILGDSNCLKADEAALTALAAAGFADLNASDAGTYWSIYQGKESTPPFDRILVPQDQSEFKWSRQYVLTPTARKDHDSRLSDHWPVLATVFSPEDDDP